MSLPWLNQAHHLHACLFLASTIYGLDRIDVGGAYVVLDTYPHLDQVGRRPQQKENHALGARQYGVSCCHPEYACKVRRTHGNDNEFSRTGGWKRWGGRLACALCFLSVRLSPAASARGEDGKEKGVLCRSVDVRYVYSATRRRAV